MKLLFKHVLRDHIFVGTVASLLTWPFLGSWGALLFWMGTILIDSDHYIKFVYYTGFKVFGIGPMFQYHEKLFEYRHHPEFLAVELFHTAEFFIIFGIIAFFLAPALIQVFWGCAFHIVVDYIHLRRHGILKTRANSFLEYFQRRKKMLREGKNPDTVFEASLQSLNLPTRTH